MIGLAEKSIVMDVDSAKEYVESKLEILRQERNSLEARLEVIDDEIMNEMQKLIMLNNPPSDKSCDCCDCHDDLPATIKVVRRSF